MNPVAEIITSVGFVLIAAAVLVVAIRGFRRLEASIGRVHVVADAVNTAVNNVEEGQPTLRQVVVGIDRRLCDHISETGVRLDRIEDHITRPRGGH